MTSQPQCNCGRFVKPIVIWTTFNGSYAVDMMRADCSRCGPDQVVILT